MDESWRKRVAIVPNGRPHRSTVEHRRSASDFEPEDFNDVFGGPPKSVLARKLSADFTTTDWYYGEIFRASSGVEVPAPVAGNMLPEFAIPVGKMTSSCVESSKEAEGGLSSVTSRLRPINIPNKWRRSSSSKHKKQATFGFPHNNCSTDNDHQSYDFTPPTKNCNLDYEAPQTNDKPHEDYYYDDDVQHLNSPSSEFTCIFHANNNDDQISEIEAEKVYNPEDNDINEAVAWAKQKFHGCNLNGGAT